MTNGQLLDPAMFTEREWESRLLFAIKVLNYKLARFILLKFHLTGSV